jgi:hypothetical protein
LPADALGAAQEQAAAFAKGKVQQRDELLLRRRLEIDEKDYDT